MADITLRDRNGAKVNYPGIDIIKLNTSGGDVQNYGAFDPETLTPDKLAAGVTVGGIEGIMTALEIVENMPIALDFSGGNQSIVAPDGVAVKSAIIQKPETLTPENIAEGVNIAGILGTLAAGGNVVVSGGQFKGASNQLYVLEHNMGVTPDFFILRSAGSLSAGNYYVAGLSFAMSDKFKELSGYPRYGEFKSYSGPSFNEFFQTVPITIDDPTCQYAGAFGNANETTITIGRVYNGNTYGTITSTNYWIAVGGLT